jgi:hypothetical protein
MDPCATFLGNVAQGSVASGRTNRFSAVIEKKVLYHSCGETRSAAQPSMAPILRLSFSARFLLPWEFLVCVRSKISWFLSFSCNPGIEKQIPLCGYAFGVIRDMMQV